MQFQRNVMIPNVFHHWVIPLVPVRSLIRLAVFTSFTTVCAFVVLCAPTAQAAMVTVVHGIDGRDVGAAQDLPVDIAVNGSCAIKQLSFAQATRVELAVGAYTVTVHSSTGSCSNAPLITQRVTVPETARAIGLVANLADTSRAPQLVAFNNDTDVSPSITVNNAATSAPIFAGAGPRGWIFVHGRALSSGSGVMVLGGPSRLRITVKIFRQNVRRVLFSEQIRLAGARVYYVVGSSTSGLRVVVVS